jgi:dihydrofolate synthase / folylpolyglutamate synthase
MFLTYREALQYLYDNLPIFQRVGAIAYKADLTNTLLLCEALGNPHRRVKTVHVAGTNGKGSTSHMLASILQTSGYKTGLYTSPHLKSFTERIRIDGQEIPEHYVLDFVNRVVPVIEQVQPSFFEITVAMAFDYFASAHVDIAVIEVGLGGRLDSTNVITPELSVITNIGWDHKEILGDTLERIAFEKAGIIKPGVPVVISERQPETQDVFIRRAAEQNAPIFFAADDYEVQPVTKDSEIHYKVLYRSDVIFHDLYIPLQGYYQKKNLTGVLKAVEILDQNSWGLTATGLVEGLSNVIHLTGLKGRWQKLGENPFIVCDTGHNIDGMREVVKQIKAQTFQKLHIVFGVVKDKDVQAVLSVLPKDAFYYFCEAKIPRAMDAVQLEMLARSKGLQGTVIKDVNAALTEARRQATKDDMIFIGGSTFVVAELENL